jgi:hypothetical protein
MEDISTIAFAGVRDLDPTAVKPTIGDQVSRRDEAALSLASEKAAMTLATFIARRHCCKRPTVLEQY